ncbi:hypothetical protein P280DRAFT_522553 [Massarina eburnea CBS 473.64]|uniref:Uncharacterized protein n=1 Tax=Massarina eburnea CBS 473.64 TaxID=1395130 RepID=A0A6A6RL66_9PLEO|nr:hypothetical protein P280DRAFT_522553 [Massarina eburnea CBS 473.64]
MQFLYTLTALSTLATAAINPNIKRAVPRHDIYIYHYSTCQGRLGFLCPNHLDGDCCTIPNAHDPASSAQYADPGSSTMSSEYDISVYNRIPAREFSSGFNMCGVRQARHTQCADGTFSRVSGAVVESGSDTVRGRADSAHVRASKYFYLGGDRRRWTIDVDSDLGRACAGVANSRKGEFLREHGQETLLR